MTMQRRQFLLRSGAAASLALLGAPTHAQGLPEDARILAGFAAGGTVDVTARRIAEKLRDVLAKRVVVENRTGAGGQIALSALKTAKPDGLTLLATPMSMLGIYPHTYKKLPYEPAVDFQPVSQAVRFDFGFAVGPLVPASVKTLPEFVAWCKANPNHANFGSPARGSVPHFALDRSAPAVHTALSTPDVVEALAKMGLEARPSTPAELAALLKKDSERWAPLVRQIGFTAHS